MAEPVFSYKRDLDEVHGDVLAYCEKTDTSLEQLLDAGVNRALWNARIGLAMSEGAALALACGDFDDLVALDFGDGRTFVIVGEEGYLTRGYKEDLRTLWAGGSVELDRGRTKSVGV